MDNRLLPVKELDAAAILAAYLQGKKTKDIAPEYGKTPEELRNFLVAEQPEDWKRARLAASLTRLEDAQEGIDQLADDIGTIKHGKSSDEIREVQTLTTLANIKLRVLDSKLKSAQWEMEKVCRQIYGELKQDQAQPPVHININLRGDAVTTHTVPPSWHLDTLKVLEAEKRDAITVDTAVEAVPSGRAAKKNRAPPTNDKSEPLPALGTFT